MLILNKNLKAKKTKINNLITKSSLWKVYFDGADLKVKKSKKVNFRINY